jgi:predicted dinucleotide-binding enzyme
MSQIQELHQQAMDLAEMVQVAKLRGNHTQAEQLSRQALEKELRAAELVASDLEAEPTRSVLHRSAATLAIDCGEIHTAERLIAIALSGNPPQEIAEELKDLFVQINLQKYFERRGIAFDEVKLQCLMTQQPLC